MCVNEPSRMTNLLIHNQWHRIIENRIAEFVLFCQLVAIVANNINLILVLLDDGHEWLTYTKRLDQASWKEVNKSRRTNQFFLFERSTEHTRSTYRQYCAVHLLNLWIVFGFFYFYFHFFLYMATIQWMSIFSIVVEIVFFFGWISVQCVHFHSSHFP